MRSGSTDETRAVAQQRIQMLPEHNLALHTVRTTPNRLFVRIPKTCNLSDVEYSVRDEGNVKCQQEPCASGALGATMCSVVINGFRHTTLGY